MGATQKGQGAKPSRSGKKTTPPATLSLASQHGNSGQSPVASPARPASAYAGPTFHASPAPSSLPMPKFLSSRSTAPDGHTNAPSHFSDGYESGSSSSSADAVPSPSRAVMQLQPGRENSPLDFFFQADREERARRQNRISAPPRSVSQKHHCHARSSSQDSHRGGLPAELHDGGAALYLPLPPHAPSNRSATAPSKAPHVRSIALSDPQSVSAQVLSSLVGGEAASTTRPAMPARGPSEPSSRFQTPSPYSGGKAAVRSASGPTTPAASDSHLSQSPLTYGNRNLSPLFHAAKTDPVKRSSSLRIEVSADTETPISNKHALARGIPLGSNPAVHSIRPGISRMPPRSFQGNPRPYAGAAMPVWSAIPGRAANSASTPPRSGPDQVGSTDPAFVAHDLRRILDLSLPEGASSTP